MTRRDLTGSRASRHAVATSLLATTGALLAGCGGATRAGAPSKSNPAPVTSSGSAVARRPPPRPAGVAVTGIPINRWQTREPARLARSEVSAARVGTTAYVVGGFTSDLQTTAAVERMDLRTGRWRRATPLPRPLNHMNAVSYRGALYVVGGYAQPGDTSAGATREFWRLDAAARRWDRMPDAPIARAAAGAAVLGDRLYVAGGRNDTRATIARLDIFDFRTGTWTQGPPLRRGREHVAAVAAAGSVWILGGRALNQGNFADVERFTPGTHSWQPQPPMPIARSSFQAVFAKGRIVVVGGEDAGSTFSEVDTMSPHTGRWRRGADLPAPRHGLGLVADGPLVWAMEGGPQAGLTTSDTVQRLRLGR